MIHLVLILIMFVQALSANAQVLQNPKEIVLELYQSYLKNSRIEPRGAPEALDLIFPKATISLGQAINREKACGVREQGFCNISADIIIDGHDWNISEFLLSEQIVNSNRRVVSASFLNLGAKTKVIYFFIKEQGEWKIDEVEAIRLKSNGITDHKWALKESLLR